MSSNALESCCKPPNFAPGVAAIVSAAVATCCRTDAPPARCWNRNFAASDTASAFAGSLSAAINSLLCMTPWYLTPLAFASAFKSFTVMAFKAEGVKDAVAGLLGVRMNASVASMDVNVAGSGFATVRSSRKTPHMFFRRSVSAFVSQVFLLFGFVQAFIFQECRAIFLVGIASIMIYQCTFNRMSNSPSTDRLKRVVHSFPK